MLHKINKLTSIYDSEDKLEIKNGTVGCGCGDPKLKIIAHLDGRDLYETRYECKCGNVIGVITKRDKNDLW